MDTAVGSLNRSVRPGGTELARRALAWSILSFTLGLPASASTGAKSVSTTDSSLRARLVGFRVGAHRGGMPASDQNTIEHFEKARQEGVDIVETDLRASLDGEVFLFHDRLLDVLTTCVGPIGAKTAIEIHGCKLRGTNRGLSTFRELLAWSAGRIVINAELKNSESIEPAIRLVREFDAYDWVYFQVEGNYRLARACDARVALLVAPKGVRAQQLLDSYLALNDKNLLVIELNSAIRTPENIRAIHAAGKLVSEDSWDFGKEGSWWHPRAECDRAFGMGIDIAITNVPEDCVEQRMQAVRQPLR